MGYLVVSEELASCLIYFPFPGTYFNQFCSQVPCSIDFIITNSKDIILLHLGNMETIKISLFSSVVMFYINSFTYSLQPFIEGHLSE